MKQNKRSTVVMKRTVMFSRGDRSDVVQIHNYCLHSAVSNTITVFPLKTN